tara:strand:- start:200 stop:736 length:537 start_codon:yes stop_codon:yes gene_type:complete
MIEIKITDEQRKRAEELYEFNVLKGSVTKGEGNAVGALGEIIVLDYFGKLAKYVGDYDYDLIIRDKKVDVKTKKQKMRPAKHHSCNIFAYNTQQKCDWYCFVFVHQSLNYGWIMGWLTKDEFYKKATFRKGGEADPTLETSWVFKGNCYTIKVTDLDNYEEEITNEITNETTNRLKNV